MSLASRYVRSIRWTVATGALQTLILLARSILLARLLPPETFGTYAFAVAATSIPFLLSEFGLGEAFLHRAPETENEEEAAATHFTLRLLLTTTLLGILLAIVWLTTTGDLRIAFTGVTVGYYLYTLGSTATLILTRRVVHRRLAIRQLLSAVLTTVAAVALAGQGAGIQALIATDIVNGLTFIFLLLLWRPVWRPRLALPTPIVRYYRDFGRRALSGALLLRAMDEIDDLWTGFFLGERALGLYSRAYQFAVAPRQLLALPLNSIADGTYAALKGDRGRLSEAFYRTNAILTRSSFPMAGLLALTATEFVPVILGAQWVPMIPTFRLMLLFTMLDPIRSTVAAVFNAVGRPEVIARVRAIQVVALVAGLFTLGTRLNIEGVGIAVNIMLLAGIVMLLREARREVDFSALRLFVVPGAALVVGLLVAYYSEAALDSNVWWMAAGVKALLFTLCYALILLVFEGKELIMMVRTFRRYSKSS